MKSLAIARSLVLILLLSILTPAADAGWDPDGNIVDHPVLLDPWDPQIVTAPDGGVIVVFVAHETDYHDIYARRYDAWGHPVWPDFLPVAVSSRHGSGPGPPIAAESQMCAFSGSVR